MRITPEKLRNMLNSGDIRMTTEMKYNYYSKGFWAASVPPVQTTRWNAGDWVKWIDSNGYWDHNKACEFVKTQEVKHDA